MNKAIITIIICVISILVSALSVHFTKKRITQIGELPKTVLSEDQKEENIKSLTIQLYVMLGGFVLSAINIFLPDGLLKFLIPILVILIVGYLLINIMAEIDAFDVKKDDVDIYLERQQLKRDELQKQKDILAEKNRLKRQKHQDEE